MVKCWFVAPKIRVRFPLLALYFYIEYNIMYFLKSFFIIKSIFIIIDVFKVSLPLLFFGIFGLLVNRKNLILILISLELMLLGINLQFILFSVFLDDILGQIFGLFIMTIAAAEVSIGLAFLVIFYKKNGIIIADNIFLLKG